MKFNCVIERSKDQSPKIKIDDGSILVTVRVYTADVNALISLMDTNLELTRTEE